MRERWECVRNFGVQTGKESMECWDTHVGKHPWSIGMFQGQGKKCWAGPQIWVSPPNPRCLWSRPGELCQGDKGAKVTPPGLLPALGDATSALLELHLEQLFPPGALESQAQEGKAAGMGWGGWHRCGFAGVRVVDFGADDARPHSGKASQCLQSSGNHPEGFFLPVCCCGALKRRGKSGKSQTPSMVVWMNHKMLQSLLLFMQGSLKE